MDPRNSGEALAFLRQEMAGQDTTDVSAAQAEAQDVRELEARIAHLLDDDPTSGSTSNAA